MGNQTGAVDKYAVSYHGGAHSHIDALPHILYQGKMYNGFSIDLLKPNGAKKLGIENMRDGIFSRGVLVDMAWFHDVDFLEPGRAITVSDLEAWETRTGVRLGSADVVLIRTGALGTGPAKRVVERSRGGGRDPLLGRELVEGKRYCGYRLRWGRRCTSVKR